MKVRRAAGHRQGTTPIVRRGTSYQQTLEALFVDGAAMAGADAVGVTRILHAAGIGAVVIGGLVVGCHTGRPRATQDLDLVIDAATLSRAVAKQLSTAVGAQTMETHPSFISFLKKTSLGDREVLDVITSKAGSYGLVFANAISLQIAGLTIQIPTAEMMVVLKYTAATNPIRQPAKQAQDWADILAILDANPKLSVATIVYLADDVVPGWGEDLKRRIAVHRKSARP